MSSCVEVQVGLENRRFFSLLACVPWLELSGSLALAHSAINLDAAITRLLSSAATHLERVSLPATPIVQVYLPMQQVRCCLHLRLAEPTSSPLVIRTTCSNHVQLTVEYLDWDWYSSRVTRTPGSNCIPPLESAYPPLACESRSAVSCARIGARIALEIDLGFPVVALA